MLIACLVSLTFQVWAANSTVNSVKGMTGGAYVWGCFQPIRDQKLLLHDNKTFNNM